MYSILPKKVDPFVSTTHEVSGEALTLFPQNPHSYGWLCKDGSWYAGWYPDLGEGHHSYVYTYQCIVVPLKGALYMPRTKGNWKHFEDTPDAVRAMLDGMAVSSGPQKKRARLSKAKLRYRKDFRQAYQRCKENYERTKEAWFEKQKLSLPRYESETLCVGDVLSYAHPLPNFETRILEIKPIAYYLSLIHI